MTHDDDQEAPGSAARSRMSGGLRRLSGVNDLEARVAALEEEVRRHEMAHLRFAELLDLVQELLVPDAHQDPERVAAAVERYTDELEGG